MTRSSAARARTPRERPVAPALPDRATLSSRRPPHADPARELGPKHMPSIRRPVVSTGHQVPLRHRERPIAVVGTPSPSWAPHRHPEPIPVILSEAKDLPVGSRFLAPLEMTVLGRFLSNLTSETRSPVLRMTVLRRAPQFRKNELFRGSGGLNITNSTGQAPSASYRASSASAVTISRVSGSARSTKSVPSRWSISC